MKYEAPTYTLGNLFSLRTAFSQVFKVSDVHFFFSSSVFRGARSSTGISAHLIWESGFKWSLLMCETDQGLLQNLPIFGTCADLVLYCIFICTAGPIFPDGQHSCCRNAYFHMRWSFGIHLWKDLWWSSSVFLAFDNGFWHWGHGIFLLMPPLGFLTSLFLFGGSGWGAFDFVAVSARARFLGGVSSVLLSCSLSSCLRIVWW